MKAFLAGTAAAIVIAVAAALVFQQMFDDFPAAEVFSTSNVRLDIN